MGRSEYPAPDIRRTAATGLRYVVSQNARSQNRQSLSSLDVIHITALKAVYVVAVMVLACAKVAIAPRALFQEDGSAVFRPPNMHCVLLIPKSVIAR